MKTARMSLIIRRLRVLAGALVAVCITGGAPAAFASSPHAFVPHRGWRWVLATPVRHIRAGGVDFAYRSIGSGPPLVLMAGLEGTMSNSWDPPVLARIARSHRVIVYDHRGVGLSRGDVSRLRIPQLADDASHLIRALRLGRADVWGQSMGGYVAQDLAIRHPRVVRRLVLTATAFGSGRFVPPAVKLPPPGDSAAILRLLFTPDRAGRTAMRAFVRRASLWRPQERLTRAALYAEYGAVARFLVIPADGTWKHLPRVRARVLVADGRRDVPSPPANSRTLARRLRHALLRLYPSGHFFYTQDQAQFVPDLLRFLSEGT